jgi:electron transfer flavoprotein alpha subunit
MSVLLIAEHNNKELKSFTLNAVTAASQIDSDVHALVIGNNCGDVAKAASELPLVKKVISVEAAHYENFLAENFAPVVIKLADNYSHIVCSANTFGKNLMPRIAAKLDTSQVSDIIKVESGRYFCKTYLCRKCFCNC